MRSGEHMFCPQCGANQAEDLKFCKSCGANLFAVRRVLTSRDAPDKFDWSKTWVADMLLSQDERDKREQVRENLEPGQKAALKRYDEIKAGVITASVGAGVMFFLYMLFQGIIASGDVPNDAAAILRVIWAAGAVPFVIGLGIAFNGLVVSKKQVEIARHGLSSGSGPKMIAAGSSKPTDPSLSPGDWQEPPQFGVTDSTTRELS